MPEASAVGIIKVNVRQAALYPWKVIPCDVSGVAYTQTQVLNWVQAASDRNGA